MGELYEPSVMAGYSQGDGALDAKLPHVYQTADAAYRDMVKQGADQSIIISGESGAGKTEATKKCLEFFAHAAGSTGVGLEDKVRLTGGMGGGAEVREG